MLFGAEINGVPMFRWCRKTKSLKVELKKLNQEFFGGLPSEVQKAREDLEHVKRRLSSKVSSHYYRKIGRSFIVSLHYVKLGPKQLTSVKF